MSIFRLHFACLFTPENIQLLVFEESVMKKSPFIGRLDELKRLKNLTRKKSASLVVVYGRRRVGKSRLIEEFGKRYRFLRFSGLPPVKEGTEQDQRNEFSKQLAKQTGLPFLQAADWGDLFSLIAREAREGRVVILLDEISWMGSKDPQFLGKLKNAWDIEFKSNPELILILCGSVSSWIEENILSSTGFMGRISLTLPLQELKLFECNQLFDQIGFRGTPYDKFKILSVTGGIPRYLEEIQGDQPAEANLNELCFQPSGVLFNEFDHIFSDLFSNRSTTYKKIVSTLVEGGKELNDIAKETKLSIGGYLSSCLEDLVRLGFIRRDYSWVFKGAKKSGLSLFRLSDNYLRFYLKYIEPNREKIGYGHFSYAALSNLPGWDSILGLQFENLVIASRSLLWKYLPFSPNDVVNDNPFFQRKTLRAKGCQIDYLIQTRYNNLFVCEIKFSKNLIKSEVIDQVKEKIARLSIPRGFSCWPVLIHVNGVSESTIESGYFSQIIDFSSLLSDGAIENTSSLNESLDMHYT